MRSKAELNSLFGRGVVEKAIARRFAVRQWEKSSVQNQTMVIRAIQDLEEQIHSPHDAVAYCQGLSTDVRDCLINSLL